MENHPQVWEKSLFASSPKLVGDFALFLIKIAVSQHIPTTLRRTVFASSRLEGGSAHTWRVENQCDKSNRPKCVRTNNGGTIMHRGLRVRAWVWARCRKPGPSDTKAPLGFFPRDEAQQPYASTQLLFGFSRAHI